MRIRPPLPRLPILLALALLAVARPAGAAFHLMMVVEVFPGYESAPNAQFVELQMYFPDQNFVLGHSIQVYDAAGGLVATFTFPGHVPNGADQASILIATTQAQSLFGVTADLVMTAAINPAGGKVCFTGSGDCMAWGNYIGSPAGVGMPFSSPGGLTLGQSAQRRLDRGNPAALDPADDTDQSASDFVSAAPTPRNNAGAVGAPFSGYASTPAPPGPISFGSVVVGTTIGASFQVREAGGATLTVSNPTLGGANPGDFDVVTSFPITIPDGGAPHTVQLTCTPQAESARSATLTLTTNDPARPTVVYDLTCTGSPTPSPIQFFTVSPCRAVDTRLAGGPLVAGVERTFNFGPCGIPLTAKAVSLNVAVTQPTAAGNVRLYPVGAPVPNAATINYSAGQTRTNNAVVGLSPAGELAARCLPSGSTHLILDVNGYFE